MNKISVLRHLIHEQYESQELADAAETGEALLREHSLNPAEKGMSYADDLFNLAYIYDTLGVWERAVSLYYASAREVIAMDGGSVDFAYRLNNLAAVLSRQGFSGNAYHIMSRAVEIFFDAFGEDDPQLADGLYNMANISEEVGKLPAAVELHQEALRIRKNTGNASDLVNSLHSIAFIYEKTNDNKQAVQYASAALNAAQGDDYCSACYYLAELYSSDKNYDSAVKLYREVLKWMDDRVGRTHSAYMNVALKLANTLAQFDKPKEALELFEEVHRSFREINGEIHLFYANCLRGMALIYEQLNRFDEAEEYMLKSVKIRGGCCEDNLEDLLFLLDMNVNCGERDKALDLIVYLLMRFNKNDERFSAALYDAFSKMDSKHVNALMPMLEDLNNRELLAPVIKRWEDWEKGEL